MCHNFVGSSKALGPYTFTLADGYETKRSVGPLVAQDVLLKSFVSTKMISVVTSRPLGKPYDRLLQDS